MPMDLPPDYVAARYRPQADALNPQIAAAKYARERKLRNVVMGTYLGILTALAGSLFYLVPKAKEELRIALEEQKAQSLAITAEYDASMKQLKAKNRDTFDKLLAEIPQAPTVTFLPYDQPWEVIQEVQTQDSDNPLKAEKPVGTPHDPAKVARTLRVAKCILESPKFKHVEVIDLTDNVGRQVVLDAGGKRYTALTWNHKRGNSLLSRDSVSFWERPQGTTGQKHLTNYGSDGLNGLVDDGGSGKPGTKSSFDMEDDPEKYRPLFQARLDEALNAFDRSPKCKY